MTTLVVFFLALVYSLVEYHFSAPGWVRRVWVVNVVLALVLVLSHGWLVLPHPP